MKSADEIVRRMIIEPKKAEENLKKAALAYARAIEEAKKDK